MTQENEHNTLMCFPLEPVFTRDKRRLPNFMDEPTAGLDPKERIRVRNYIADLSKQRIVLLATHIVSDIESIADEVLLLKKGRLVAEGKPEVLIAEMEEQGRTPLYGRMSLEDVYMAYIGTGEE